MVARSTLASDVRKLLATTERRLLIHYVVSVLVLNATETAMALVVMPFISCVIGASATLRAKIDAGVALILGRAPVGSETITLVGLAAIAIVAINFVAQVICLRTTAAFVSGVTLSATKTLMTAVLRLPVREARSRSPATLVQLCGPQLAEVVNSCLAPLLQGLGRVTSAIFACTVIAVIHPGLALGLFGCVATVFGLSTFLLSGRSRRFGSLRWAAAKRLTRITTEVLRGYREIRVAGVADTAIASIAKEQEVVRRASVRHASVTGLTRPVAEAGSLLVVLTLLLLYARSGEAASTFVPAMAASLFVLGRALPSFASVHGAFSNLQSRGSILHEMGQLFDSGRAAAPQVIADATKESSSFELQGVTVEAPGASQPILKGVDLVIPPRRMVAIVGHTGSGKSTLLDVLLGLVPPDRGALLVNGVPLDDASAEVYRSSLGYVPQEVLQIQGTVAQNIALSFEAGATIDEAKIEECMRLACLGPNERGDHLHAHALLGPDGVAVSGGELQRLGIARALYRSRTTLILDEATSALDPATEHRVLRHLREIAHHATVIVVTHRFANLALFDDVVMIDDGRVVARGRYADLSSSNPAFQKLAGAS